MSRSTLKTVGSVLCHATGIDRVVGSLSGAAGQPLVLCYHRVVDDVRGRHHGAPAMMVGVTTLQRQLDEIGRRRRFVGLDELAEALGGGRRFPAPVAAVTFDDGYADVHRHALPVLSRKGIPAAVFVVTGVVGKRALLAHDRLFLLLREAAARRPPAELDGVLEAHGIDAGGRRGEMGSADVTLLAERILERCPRSQVDALMAALDGPLPEDAADDLLPMTWPMLAEMASAGVVVGSHTHTHRVLPNEPAAVVREELVRSRRRIEKRLGIEVRHLAYPDGQHTPACLEAAALAGYRFAFTTCFHRSARRPLLTIPRRTFWERTSAGIGGRFSRSLVACQAQGVLDLVRPCRRSHGPREAPGSIAGKGRPT